MVNKLISQLNYTTSMTVSVLDMTSHMSALRLVMVSLSGKDLLSIAHCLEMKYFCHIITLKLEPLGHAIMEPL